MKILYVFLIASLYIVGISAFGSNIFYGTFTLTNQQFGSGSAFKATVWFNANLQKMRLDYFSISTNTKFMSILYDYASKDQYQVCGSSCSRATYITPMPLFQGDATNFALSPSCQTPDYPGPRACVSSCTTYVGNPPAPLGIFSLSYNDTNANQLCLVKFSVQSGKTFAPEWQMITYLTSGWTAAQNPTDPNIYSSVISGVTCPKPTCFAELDVALVIDESGSIFAANAWPDVQNFVLNLISGFNIGSSTTRVGLTYFSGLDDCYHNWTGTAQIDCVSKNSNDPCVDCGGRWQQMTTGVITSKSSLIDLVNSNNGAQGYTCIACGIDMGIKMLNFAPKSNVGKVIILMTDGAQNRVTDGLLQNAKYAYDMGISIIAVGVGPYKYSDLQSITTSDKIFTTANYNQLSNLISNIVTPLCQPLPPIESCDFCSGLCTCQANCVCPSCNDFDACTTDKCDIKPPPQGTLGLCTHTPLSCNDNNVCTNDYCNSTTGCYNPLIPKPSNLTDSFCVRYTCKNPGGFTPTDQGASLCPASSNKCIINYCNTTVGSTDVSGNLLVGSCQTINLTDPMYPYGSSVTYKNSAGQTITVAGCGKPAGAPACAVYGCTPSTGTCTINVASCGCQSGADCYDGNGCTYDICNNGVCSNPIVDCYSILSNGSCTINMPTNVSSIVGDLYYNGTINVTTAQFPLDAAGLPVVGSYSCAYLACYGGVKNTFSCSALSQTTFKCLRQTGTCSSSACQDTVCRTTGVWSSGKLGVDCGKTYTRSCNDGVFCTTDTCNPSFSGTTCSNTSCVSQSGGNRCLYTTNTCNDGKACTVDSCDNSTGCVNTLLPPPTPNYCFITGCNNSTGNFSYVNTSRCIQGPDLCYINYCNTTNGQCEQINKTSMAIGTFVTYVDAYSSVRTAYGCANNTPSCIIYGCNPSTGQCFVDNSQCPCTDDDSCNDGNGCTVDICNTTTGQCQSTPVDCFSVLSNGGCTYNQTLVQTNATGYYYYNLGIQNNNPNPPAFVAGNYNCDQLACYGGQRSTYSCVPVGSSNFTCQRTTTNCQKGGCLDSICRSVGAWVGGQMQTDCNATFAPDCVSNACLLSTCNTDYIYAGGLSRCINFSNATNCIDNNVCTNDTCDPLTGCKNDPIPPPAANTTCYTYTCDPIAGYSKNNVGPTNCPTDPANLCWITYCNSTTNTCTTIKKDEIPYGQTVSYVDSDGFTYTVTGCMNPGDPVLCRQYGCDKNTGQCFNSSSTCACTSDQSCYDGTGCTIDVCDFKLNQCNRTTIDCFSLLSNGTCSQGQNYSLDIMTGLNVYYKNASINNNYTNVDGNDLPFPNFGVSRTCGQLACYNGQPSQYQCFSLAEGSYTCQRNYLNCDRNGCIDNICRALGTWTNGQMDTDCNTTYVPQCADENACTDDYCDAAWVPSQPVSQRCIHQVVNATSYCDDGNFCTKDYCDPKDTTGNPCKHSLYSESYLRKTICKTNKSLTCKSVACLVNQCVYYDIVCQGPNLCIYFTCNKSTNGTCKQFPTGIYKIDKCGVCGGNGLSCIQPTPADPKKTSIAVSLGVGLGVGLFFALLIIGVLSKRSFDVYNAIAMESQGSITVSPTYQGAETHFDSTDYRTSNRNFN